MTGAGITANPVVAFAAKVALAVVAFIAVTGVGLYITAWLVELL